MSDRVVFEHELMASGPHLTGLILANSLVLLPTDVAMQNLEYLHPSGIPRTNVLVTERGTVVHDLRLSELYTTNLLLDTWRGVNLTRAAREMWYVVVNHEPPSPPDRPLYEFLLLRSGGLKCQCHLWKHNW